MEALFSGVDGRGNALGTRKGPLKDGLIFVSSLLCPNGSQRLQQSVGTGVWRIEERDRDSFQILTRYCAKLEQLRVSILAVCNLIDT